MFRVLRGIVSNATAIRLTGATPTAPLGGTAANFNDNTTATNCDTGNLGNLSGLGFADRIMAKLDFGSPVVVSQVDMQISRTGAPGSGAVNATIGWSNDDSSWTELGIVNCSLLAAPDTLRSFTDMFQIEARYWALAPQAGNFGTDNAFIYIFNVLGDPLYG